MGSSILNILGFHVGDHALILPDIKNEQTKHKIELGSEQIELVLQQSEQDGKKGMRVNVMIKYLTS
jgi:hypothetical protein